MADKRVDVWKIHLPKVKMTMNVISIETYKQAKTMGEIASLLYNEPSDVSSWYEFLSDLENPKFDWVGIAN